MEIDAYKGRAVLAALEGELKTRPGVTERTARALRLKNELNLILELVVEMRRRLENELKDGAQQKFIDGKFIDKVAKLTQAYERLTSSRIALGKAEKAEEAEMTPAQEKAAVMAFVASLPHLESYEVIHDMWANYLKSKSNDGRTSSKEDKLPDDFVRQ